MYIDESDIKALKLRSKVTYCKVEILNSDYKTIDMLEGSILSGNYSINSESTVRRTCNITMVLNKKSIFNESLYYNNFLKVYLGFNSIKNNIILYYCMGIYAFEKESFKYDPSTNEVSFDLSDLCSLLDNDHYGTDYGALSTSIYATDPKTGERLTGERVILQNIVKNLLKDFSDNNQCLGKPKINFNNCRISPIGRANGRGDNYKELGYSYPWNELPYDLDFSADSSLLDKLTQIKDLYGVYEFFFDVDGVFIFQEIPHTDDDMIALDNDIVSDLVLSESTDRNIYDVKNVVEVWGKSVDINKEYRMAEGTYNASTGVYSVTINDYIESGYADGLKLALKVDKGNSADVSYININNLGNKKIIDKLTGEPFKPNQFRDGITYIFEYSTNIDIPNGGFYYVSSYQVHAVAIMTNGEAKLNESYYKEKYNTDNIVFITDKDNKYCIEYVGEIRKKYSGDKYANLESDVLAADYAKSKLEQLCRKTTSLSLEMIVVPWLDVNQKIEYKTQSSNEIKTYITKSISGDLLSGKMSVNLMEFYPTLDVE